MCELVALLPGDDKRRNVVVSIKSVCKECVQRKVGKARVDGESVDR